MSGPSRHSGKPPEFPTSPADKSQPESRLAFRSIAPKAKDRYNSPPIESRQSTLSVPSTWKRRKLTRRCHVCFKISCRLASHKLFVKATSGAGSVTDEDAAFTASYAYELAQGYIDQSMAPSKVDPFYNLPVPPELNTAEMHRLFHWVFTFEGMKLVSIPTPEEIVANMLLSPFMAPALVDTALCLSILAVAAAVVSPQEATLSKNVRTLTLMGQAMENMRETIDSEPNLIADTTIAAASILWSVNWYLDDTEALRQHRDSVSSFVKKRGGLHMLGMSETLARYITWVDICAGLTLQEQCHFPKPGNVSVKVDAHGRRYGHFWDSLSDVMKSAFDPLIVRGCRDAARVIEVLEETEQNKVTGTRFYYILHTLSLIMNENSAFHASYGGTGTLNECVALTLYLVKVKIFAFSPLKAPTLMDQYGNRLIEAIREAGRPSYWRQHRDLLIWMLFVLLLIEDEFEHREWCFEALNSMLESEFGQIEDWPAHWEEDIKSRIVQFVWCDTRFSAPFNLICTSIRCSLIEDVQDSNDDD